MKSRGLRIGVISDTHIGYVRSLNKKGIFIDDNQDKDIIWTLKESLKDVIYSENNKKIRKLDYFIIAGDFFHEFSKIDYIVLEKAKNILNFIIKEIAQEVILIKGNHDTMISSIFKDISSKSSIKLCDYYEIGDYFITHGNEILHNKKNKIKLNEKTIIIGHEHPAVRLFSKTRFEEYRCFLVGKGIIVLPSFNFLVEGHDILRDKLFSPYLSEMGDNFYNSEAYLVMRDSNKSIYVENFHKLSGLLD